MNAIVDRAPVAMLARMQGILERARNEILSIALVSDIGAERTRAEVLEHIEDSLESSADELAVWGAA
jgi:RNase adaptor protein for sRNA GlmZ degradation